MPTLTKGGHHSGRTGLGEVILICAYTFFLEKVISFCIESFSSSSRIFIRLASELGGSLKTFILG